MSDLAKIVWAVVSHFPEGVSAKKLVKLIYFIDLKAAETLGHTISGADYLYHHYGPLPCHFYHARDELLQGMVAVALRPTFGLDWHLHRPQQVCDLNATYNPQERQIVVDVLQELGDREGSLLERMSKETEPLKQARKGELLQLTRAGRQRAAWERMGIPVEEIDSIVEHRTPRQEKEAGCPEAELQIIPDLEPLRKRANAACMGEESPEG